jgi:cytochrome c biogenesis protein CcmG/thiol:disulfide interchange protein DsbE
MYRAKLIAFAACTVTTVLGCSESTPNEPKKLAEVVDELAVEPISPPADKVAESRPVATAKRDNKVEQAQLKIVDEAKEPADDAASEPATVPPVQLSSEHAELVRVKIGEPLPDVELPKTDGGNAKLSSLYGKAATVVVFWKGDRQMALDELADLGPDVVDKFGSRGVEVIGVAVDQPAAEAQSTAQKADANFPLLVDADGKAFDQVGSQMLPWTLVLDSNGKVVWFDLEYSLSTRRELQQALLATVR